MDGKRMLIVLALAWLGLLCAASSAWSGISLIGVEQDAVAIDMETITNAFPKTAVTIESQSETGESTAVEKAGALLADLLSDYGYTQEELEAVRFTAGDGYSMEVPSEILARRDIVLAYEKDGQPLAEESQPLRVIIPEERAMFWVRNLEEIHVLKDLQPPRVESIRFLETKAAALPAGQTTLDTGMLADAAGDVWERVYLQAADGFQRYETKDNFLKGSIAMRGEGSPAFVSDALPKGMHVRELTAAALADVGFVSVVSAKNLLGSVSFDEYQGLLLSDVAALFAMDNEQARHRLTGYDGYAVEVEYADLEQGLVYEEGGELRTYFPHLPQNTAVRGIYSLEILNGELK